jgi:hypothetical protein
LDVRQRKQQTVTTCALHISLKSLKSMRLRWARHAALMGYIKTHKNACEKSYGKRDELGDLQKPVEVISKH